MGMQCSPMGSHLILFLFYIFPQVTFLTLKFYWVYRVFWPSDFLSPVAGAMQCSPMGSHLILFLFYIFPQVTFLSSKSYWVYRVFLALQFFILTDGMDGWMDGWMGWMVGPLFFLAHIL